MIDFSAKFLTITCVTILAEAFGFYKRAAGQLSAVGCLTNRVRNTFRAVINLSAYLTITLVTSVAAAVFTAQERHTLGICVTGSGETAIVSLLTNHPPTQGSMVGRASA